MSIAQTKQRNTVMLEKNEITDTEGYSELPALDVSDFRIKINKISGSSFSLALKIVNNSNKLIFQQYRCYQ